LIGKIFKEELALFASGCSGELVKPVPDHTFSFFEGQDIMELFFYGSAVFTRSLAKLFVEEKAARDFVLIEAL
jgi:hypothetical protein